MTDEYDESPYAQLLAQGNVGESECKIIPAVVMVVKYQATKIYLRCEADVVHRWARFMTNHLSEVAMSLRQERVRHEMWWMGRDPDLYVIGVMDVDDKAASVAIAASSSLAVDREHRAFKENWDRSRAVRLNVDPEQIPQFENAQLLLDVKVDLDPE